MKTSEVAKKATGFIKMLEDQEADPQDMLEICNMMACIAKAKTEAVLQRRAFGNVIEALGRSLDAMKPRRGAVVSLPSLKDLKLE